MLARCQVFIQRNLIITFKDSMHDTFNGSYVHRAGCGTTFKSKCHFQLSFPSACLERHNSLEHVIVLAVRKLVPFNIVIHFAFRILHGSNLDLIKASKQKREQSWVSRGQIEGVERVSQSISDNVGNQSGKFMECWFPAIIDELGYNLVEYLCLAKIGKFISSLLLDHFRYPFGIFLGFVFQESLQLVAMIGASCNKNT
jgi:hypothetical protein